MKHNFKKQKETFADLVKTQLQRRFCCGACEFHSVEIVADSVSKLPWTQLQNVLSHHCKTCKVIIEDLCGDLIADQKGNTLKPITEIGAECFMNKSKVDK